jgi:metal-responsive CopG/Arc/MetJ family transcriptional regulator
MTQVTSRKVTVSLSEDLLSFADSKASELGMTRSRLIGRALEELRLREKDQLAVEGYRFYAQESREFADATAEAFSEVIDDGSTW